MLLTSAVDKHTMRSRSLSVSILEDNISERIDIDAVAAKFFYTPHRTSHGSWYFSFDMRFVQVTKRIFVVNETSTSTPPAVRLWPLAYSNISRQFNLFCRNFDTFLPISTALSVKFDIVRIKQELKNV